MCNHCSDHDGLVYQSDIGWIDPVDSLAADIDHLNSAPPTYPDEVYLPESGVSDSDDC